MKFTLIALIALVGLTGCGYKLVGPEGDTIVSVPPSKGSILVPVATTQVVAVQPQYVQPAYVQQVQPVQYQQLAK